MRRVLIAGLVLVLLSSLLPGAAAVTMTINATPVQAHIGDVIRLSGSIEGVKTIAVYLFVTGPDLNPQGVNLENLNIPTGRGLFTTAPVNIANGKWEYTWDTSVILGDMKPGRYMVYAVSTPTDRLRYTKGEFAATEINFLPSEAPPTEIPLPPHIALGALLAVSGLAIVARLNSRRSAPAEFR